MMLLSEYQSMAKREGKVETMPIRIGKDALEAARVAAAYRGMTVQSYATEKLLEAARRDIEEGHRQWTAGDPKAVPTLRKRGK